MDTEKFQFPKSVQRKNVSILTLISCMYTLFSLYTFLYKKIFLLNLYFIALAHSGSDVQAAAKDQNMGINSRAAATEYEEEQDE